MRCRLALLASLFLYKVCLSDAPITLNSSFPDPNIDPFYAQDELHVLNQAQPGEILRRRNVRTAFERNVNAASQLFYRTTSSTEEAQGTVATVWKPSKPKVPAQILSYHTYQDSVSLNCNPSWALIPGTASHGKIPVSLDTAIYIQWALDRGIYVVVPDHLGPKAAWLAGIQSGAAVLDGIRATRTFFNLPKDTEIGLLGYSGGGHATSWADNMASTYAPDLNIIGSISGGTIIDALTAFQYIDGSILSGFAGAGLIGLMNAYPELNDHVMNHFDEQGKRKLEMFRKPNMCIPEVFVTNVFTNFTSHFINEGPLDHELVRKVMRKETLLGHLSTIGTTTPTYPRLIWHAEMDEIVPIEGAQQYIKEQCSKGANIQFQTVPLSGHIMALMIGLPGVVNFLERIFSHTTPKVECGSSEPDFPKMVSPILTHTIIGKNAFQFLYSLGGSSLAGTSMRIVIKQMLDR